MVCEQLHLSLSDCQNYPTVVLNIAYLSLFINIYYL